ncbi:NAD(P)-dependent alcohol dehydrogenase [Echinicola salinicaeni]|uniref:NAD(P)-dependent alcohol dehydrogenase n=1 Tax=Echinicola salinicaeni TaxID=2762757 RepID=UPI0016483DAC|nr:NAD(P)-dependent alcohol dehydrogenase [Echinicola salinicaeni]
MRAIITTGYGSPEIFKIGKVAKLTAKPNELLIKIHASSVTKADTMMRTGKPYIGRLMIGLTKPKKPIWGTGFAGIVESVGSEVTQFKVGDKVFGENIASMGTYAEFVTVPEDGIVAHIPKNLGYEEAACLCDGGITSLNFLCVLGNIKSGQKVLINGASGSLGTAAVQIAKYFGAEVTGVCSSKNIDLVKELGADHVIDYSKEDFTTNANTYDIIYDTVGKRSFAECRNALTEHGVYASPVLGMPLLSDMMFTAVFGKKKAKFSATGALPQKKIKRLLKFLIEIIESGKLRLVIDRTYPLEQLADAHQYIDKGHKKGNVVLMPLI